MNVITLLLILVYLTPFVSSMGQGQRAITVQQNIESSIPETKEIKEEVVSLRERVPVGFKNNHLRKNLFENGYYANHFYQSSYIPKTPLFILHRAILI
ncbi:hypothetical protein RCC89_07265 [Cytophagaceae bacterium ABcell3]|nr:hypothetical protein RCC89_07265 [Cytophagaceae bacterium ABcell3]